MTENWVGKIIKDGNVRREWTQEDNRGEPGLGAKAVIFQEALMEKLTEQFTLTIKVKKVEKGQRTDTHSEVRVAFTLSSKHPSPLLDPTSTQSNQN